MKPISEVNILRSIISAKTHQENNLFSKKVNAAITACYIPIINTGWPN